MAAFCVVEYIDVIEYVATSILPRGVDYRLIRSRLRSCKKALGYPS